MTSRRPSPPILAPARTLTCLVGAALAACADTAAPDRSPDVLARPQSASQADTAARPPAAPPASPSAPASSVVRGTVVDVPTDAAETWRPVGGVRLEVGERDANTGAMRLVANTTSGADGGFVFDKLTVATGLLYVRAVPADARYRATRWIAAYTLAAPLRTGVGADNSWTVGAYLVLERANTPQRAYAPVLLAGTLGSAVPHSVQAYGYVPVPNATVLISPASNYAPGPDSLPPQPAGLPIASARTDAGGHYFMPLPGRERFTSAPPRPPRRRS